jgi:hypothetical protein
VTSTVTGVEDVNGYHDTTTANDYTIGRSASANGMAYKQCFLATDDHPLLCGLVLQIPNVPTGEATGPPQSVQMLAQDRPDHLVYSGYRTVLCPGYHELFDADYTVTGPPGQLVLDGTYRYDYGVICEGAGGPALQRVSFHVHAEMIAAASEIPSGFPSLQPVPNPTSAP